jgi:hypothetical protein
MRIWPELAALLGSNTPQMCCQHGRFVIKEDFRDMTTVTRACLVLAVLSRPLDGGAAGTDFKNESTREIGWASIDNCET